ncbi:MAG TPA: carbamoyl phosphate synthase small subunit, partial [Clostridia bacterium]|nr:carbamoyl phosphate synthase small subunit [Clostridia bacterium]
MQGKLVLADGTIYLGRAFGAVGEKVGEVVFTTNICGYQEVLTDPSHRGQIVVMTYPLIGNCGINNFSNQSSEPQVAGFVAREFCELPFHWQSEG